MEKILLVEDEARIRNIVLDYFTAHGLSCDLARNGEEALDILRDNDYDAILLDILMPGLDGFAVCQSVRKKSNVPILFLTALGSEEDTLKGYALGCDDYVVKPFSPKELMARIRAVLNRASASQRTEDVIRYEGLEINFTAREVKIDGEKVSMTPKEYDLLFYLVKNMNIALSREKLLEEVWGFDFYGDDRTVDTHIKMLRNSLGKYRNLIVTLRGMGYKFEKIQ